MKRRNEQNGQREARTEPLERYGMLDFIWLRCARDIATPRVRA